MITAQQVKEAMINNNITHVDHHNCSLCGYMTRFVREGECLFFDPGCDCTGGEGNLELLEFQDAADWINMQSDPDVTDKLAKKFGVVL